MRCPQCRKKNHPDDISCAWCGASLRERAKPAEDIPVCDAPVNTRYKKFVPQSIVILICMLAGLVATYYLSRSPLFGAEVYPEPVPEIMAGENVLPMDANLVQWEGFTIDAIGYEASGEGLKIFYTAKNDSDYTIACADPQVSADGCALSSLMYLELPPGASGADVLWIGTEELEAALIREIQDLEIGFQLVNAADFTILAQPEPVVLWLNLELP